MNCRIARTAAVAQAGLQLAVQVCLIGRPPGINARYLGPLKPEHGTRYRYSIPTRVDRVREFLRGAVRLHILHHAAHGEVHGAWMAKELAGHGYEISPGSLYPTLHKMESEGLITSRSQIVDGRVRRSYVVTAEGRRTLESTKRQLRELADEVLGDIG
jgi:DNA-binding PadR family transcriptional regulator